MERLTFFAIPLALLFSFYQFLLNKSIWLDESYLALNLVDKNYLELLKPLDNGQVAPIGFLLVEKFILSIFHTYPDLELRVFPFLSFLGSIFIFYQISTLLSFNRIIQNVLTICLSLNFWLLRYSCEIKQYSSDVLITLIIIFFTLKLDFKNKSSIMLYTLICCLSIFFSNVSIFTLISSFIYLFIQETFRSKNYKVFIIFITTFIFFLFYFFLFIYNHPTKSTMKLYWDFAFLPINPFKSEFYIFLYDNVIKHFFSDLLHFGNYWYVPFIIFSLSLLKLFKNNKELLLLMSIPFLLHLFLSGFKIYPFTGRLIIYLIPISIIIIGFLMSYLKKEHEPVIIFAIPIVFYLNIYQSGFPIVVQDVKGAVKSINNSIEKQDIIVTDESSYQVLQYYQKIKMLNFKRNIILNKNFFLNRNNTSFFYVGSKNPESDSSYLLKFKENYKIKSENEFKSCNLYYFTYND